MSINLCSNRFHDFALFSYTVNADGVLVIFSAKEQIHRECILKVGTKTSVCGTKFVKEI